MSHLTSVKKEKKEKQSNSSYNKTKQIPRDLLEIILIQTFARLHTAHARKKKTN